MNRKLIGTFVAVLAFAGLAVFPAIGSAHWLKETVNGVETIVMPPAKVVAYSEEGQQSLFQGSNGWKVECDENILTGSVHANHDNFANVHITIEDAWFQGKEPGTACKSTLGAAKVTVPAVTNFGGASHWCIKTVVPTDNFILEPHNCTGVGGAFTFTVHMGGIKCGFERKENIEGTFTTGDVLNKPVTLTFNPNQNFVTDKVLEHSALCPPNWSVSLGAFEMYTDTGVTSNQYRNPLDTMDPVYMTP